jgi:hypothetical protein
MPAFLKFISFVFPNTLSSDSLRNIVFKKASLENYHVYKGFIALGCWMLGSFLLSILFNRRKFS